MTELNILCFSFGGFRSPTDRYYYLLSSLLEIRICKLCLLGDLRLHYVPNFAVCKLRLLGDLCLHCVGNFAVCKRCLLGDLRLHYVPNFAVCKLRLLGDLCLHCVGNFAVCKRCLLGDLRLHYVPNFAVCQLRLLGDLCTPAPSAASNITTMAVPSPRPLCSGHVGEATLHQSAQLVFARRQEAQGKEWDTDNRQMLAAPSYPPEVRSSFPRQRCHDSQDPQCAMGLLAEGKEFVDSNGGNDEVSVQVNSFRNSEGFRTSSGFESHGDFECAEAVRGLVRNEGLLYVHARVSLRFGFLVRDLLQMLAQRSHFLSSMPHAVLALRLREPKIQKS